MQKKRALECSRRVSPRKGSVRSTTFQRREEEERKGYRLRSVVQGRKGSRFEERRAKERRRRVELSKERERHRDCMTKEQVLQQQEGQSKGCKRIESNLRDSFVESLLRLRIRDSLRIDLRRVVVDEFRSCELERHSP